MDKARWLKLSLFEDNKENVVKKVIKLMHIEKYKIMYKWFKL